MEKLIIDGVEVEIHRNYFDNGKVQKEWTQTLYELHGYSKEYYENGNIKIHNEYRHNKNYLISSHWYSSGQKKQEIIRENENYFRQDYFESGKLKLRVKVSKELKFVGESTFYFENGNIEHKELYDISGQNIGESFSYFENGKPCLFGKYENGVFLRISQWNSEGVQVIKGGKGLIELKDTEGKTIQREIYANGTLNGECLYFKNGLLKTTVNYENGKQNGKTISYYNNGKIKEILTFVNGEIVYEERNLPKYEKPKLESSVYVFLPEKRNSNNVIIDQKIPEIENLREVIQNIEVNENIYKECDNEGVLTEVYRVKIDKDGVLTRYVRSSGSIIHTELLEKALKSLRFKIKTVDDFETEIWLKFDFRLINDSN